eukprot:6176088-Pleurochrysis_carterae.AAC.3
MSAAPSSRRSQRSSTSPSPPSGSTQRRNGASYAHSSIVHRDMDEGRCALCSDAEGPRCTGRILTRASTVRMAFRLLCLLGVLVRFLS